MRGPEPPHRSGPGPSPAVRRSSSNEIAFDPKRFTPTPLSYDAALARRAWELSEALVRERGLSFTPG
ncbi:hypothetical protein [Sorangium sp. So ce233]|uniref:hypothetical protein n=1 Tax=Sorangium sp. So ce233 TaxID=3133290 RepID=UPI003F5D9D7E